MDPWQWGPCTINTGIPTSIKIENTPSFRNPASFRHVARPVCISIVSNDCLPSDYNCEIYTPESGGRWPLILDRMRDRCRAVPNRHGRAGTCDTSELGASGSDAGLTLVGVDTLVEMQISRHGNDQILKASRPPAWTFQISVNNKYYGQNDTAHGGKAWRLQGPQKDILHAGYHWISIAGSGSQLCSRLQTFPKASVCN